MPKQSMPPDLPPEEDMAEEIEAVPLVNDRNAEVRHVLQDVILFAQDFMDVLDDLAEEPIVPLEMFFVRPDFPAGRFRGPGRQIPNNRPPAGQPYNVRPGMMGRRRQGGNIRQPQRPILRRPPRIIERPIRGVGNLRQPLRPVQLPAAVPREQISGGEINEEPDNVGEPREFHASDEESNKPSVSGVEQEGPSVSGVEQEGPSVSGVEQEGPSVSGVEQEGPSVSGVEQEGPSVSGVEQEGPSVSGVEQEGPSVSGAVQEVPSVSGAVQEGPSVSGVGQNKPTVVEAKAAGLASPRKEAGGLHRAEPDNGHSSPEQAKRARLDIPDVSRSGRSPDTGSDDSSMEVVQDSPKSKKE